MIVWIDAQLSPTLAEWLTVQFGVEARPVRESGLQGSKDLNIFESARSAGAVVMTKDADFRALLDKHGSPPQVLWITCGNTSTFQLKKILTVHLSKAPDLLRSGEPLVEIGDSF